MATRNLAIRLSVQDGRRVKAELKSVGDEGHRALTRIEQASRPASRALLAFNDAARSVRGSMEAMAARLGPVGAALSALGPAGIAAGAALAGLGTVLAKAVEASDLAERRWLRIEGVLRATGHAAGITARQIRDFARRLEADTLASADAVEEAAAVLLTFRSVAGETFFRTLRVAQDLAAVLGSNLLSTVVQLGKALEDPIRGLSSLREVGVSFTFAQERMIRAMVEAGRTAEAQAEILSVLERQVGGAGAAEAGGLSGKVDRLTAAWTHFLEALGETPAVASAVQGALDFIAGGLEGLTDALGGGDISRRIVETNRALLEWRDTLRRLESSPFAPSGAIEHTRREVARLQAELDALLEQARAEARRVDEERRKAEEGRRRAQVEQALDAVARQKAEIDKALERLATGPEERIRRINEQLAETKRRLEALRRPETAKAVDDAIRAAEELARRQIEAIRRPMREAAARAAAAARRVVQDLRRQLEGLTDPRRAFIEQAVSRLPAGAGEEMRREVERLAGALYDQRQASEAAAEAERARQRLMDEGARLTERLLTPTERYERTMARLRRLLAEGAIDQRTFNRAAEEAARKLEEARRAALDASTAFGDGVKRALLDYAEAAQDAASVAEEATTRAFRGMEDALVSFVTTGKAEFGDLVDSILADITRLAVRQAITGPLAGALGGALGNDPLGIGGLSASLFHRGGVVGEDAAPARMVDAAAFLAAPRYHHGGTAGLAPDEVPAILRRGEIVLTREQARALADARGSDRRERPVQVTINVTTPDVGGFRASQGQIAAEVARAIERAQRNL